MPEHTGEGEIYGYEIVSHPISPELKTAIAAAERASDAAMREAGLTDEQVEEVERLRRDIARRMLGC